MSALPSPEEVRHSCLTLFCGSNSAGRVSRCQRDCRGFKSRLPLYRTSIGSIRRIFRLTIRLGWITTFLRTCLKAPWPFAPGGFRLRRRSQVAKAEVCKTSIHRFESGRRLVANSVPPGRGGGTGRRRGLKIPRAVKSVPVRFRPSVPYPADFHPPCGGFFGRLAQLG